MPCSCVATNTKRNKTKTNQTKPNHTTKMPCKEHKRSHSPAMGRHMNAKRNKTKLNQSKLSCKEEHCTTHPSKQDATPIPHETTPHQTSLSCKEQHIYACTPRQLNATHPFIDVCIGIKCKRTQAEVSKIPTDPKYLQFASI